MIRRLLAVCLCVPVLLLSTTGCSRGERASEQLVVSGSTTILPIAEVAAEEFKVIRPDSDVLVSGLGSSSGIESVATGTSDIGTSSRDLKPEEENLGLTDIPIAFDAIAVIVHPDNPVKNLTTAQLKAIFQGKVTNWREVGGDDRRIGLVNRDEASGTREAFLKIVMDKEPFEPAAVVLPGTGQVRSVVADSPGAIGYISLGFVNSGVRPVSVDGVHPSEASVVDRTYPIARTLHFFTKGAPSGLTKEYVDFVLSDEIQQTTVLEAGFIPITVMGEAQ